MFTSRFNYCYKIVFSLVKFDFCDFFEFSVSSARGHAYSYTNRDVAALDFFACRVVNVWNSLPDSVCFTSLSTFKRSIRMFDFSNFLLY